MIDASASVDRVAGPPPPASPRSRWIQLAVGLAISAALIWWTFRRSDWGSSWEVMRGAEVGWMALAVLLATVPFPLRIPRWRILLRRTDGESLESATLWHAIAIGFAANNVLPLRAGEVLRIAVVSRLGSVPVGTALSSVAVERALDVLVAAALLSAALLVSGIDASATLSGDGLPLADVATLVGAAGMGCLLLAALAAWQTPWTLRVTRRLLPPTRAGNALYDFGERVLVGLAALRDPRTALPAIGWSLAIWLCNGSAFFVAFTAFDFPIPLSGAFVLQGALMVGIALPSSPGYIGVFEAAIAGTLAALYDIPFEAGLAYGLLYHVTTFLPIILLGTWSAVHTGLGRATVGSST